MTGASWDSQRCDNQSDDLHPPSIRGSAQDCRGMVNHSFYHPNSKTAALHPLQPEETQDGVQDTLTPHRWTILTSCISCSSLERKSLQRVVKAAQHTTKMEVEERYVR